ncbi:MAG TPA: response regulator [Acidobacteriota bacterium]
MRIPLIQPQPGELIAELESERFLDLARLACASVQALRLELDRGCVWLRGGAIVAARAGERRGRAALTALLGAESSRLALKPEPDAVPHEFELRPEQVDEALAHGLERRLLQRGGGGDGLLLLELRNYRGDLLLRRAGAKLAPELESALRGDPKLEAALHRFLRSDPAVEAGDLVQGHPLLLRYLPRARLFARLLLADGASIDEVRRWCETGLESLIAEALQEAVGTCCRSVASAAPASPGKIILVITDRHQVHQQLRATLAAEGYSVHVASDGEQGFALARQLLPHLIISDIALKIMDGWELLWMVRKDPDLKDTPFVFRSEDGSWMEEQRDLAHGADGNLPADSHAERVIEKVKSIFHER